MFRTRTIVILVTDFGAQCGAQAVELEADRHLEDVTKKVAPYPNRFKYSVDVEPRAALSDVFSDFEHFWRCPQCAAPHEERSIQVSDTLLAEAHNLCIT